MSDQIPGGLADGLSLRKIADKHRVNIDQLRQQLELGIEVELEHTSSKAVATEIAMDHLYEDPTYYQKLKQVERQRAGTLKEIAKINVVRNSVFNYLSKGGQQEDK